jgi:excisionase family DNA binding protein
LLKEEMDYLESINREPFLPATERDKKIGISAWKGHKLREDLIKKGVLKKYPINTGKKGGVITLVDMTAKGRAISDGLGMRANILRGKGSFPHQFWAYAIKSYYEKTGEAVPSIENDSLGKAADVTLIFGDKRVAVEIAISDNESFNASKDLEVGFDEVWVCTETEEMMDKVKKSIQKNLGSEILEKIKFRLLTEFYNKSAYIKRNIGAQSCGLRADDKWEEKEVKEGEEIEEKKEKKKKKEVNILKNINKNIKQNDSNFLTVEEVSAYLSIPHSTIKKWVASRRLPVVKLGHGKRALVRIRKSDLESWVEKQVDSESGIVVSKDKKPRRTKEKFSDFIEKLKSDSKKGNPDEK